MRVVTTQFDRDNAEYFARIRAQNRAAREAFEQSQAARLANQAALLTRPNPNLNVALHLLQLTRKLES